MKKESPFVLFGLLPHEQKVNCGQKKDLFKVLLNPSYFSLCYDILSLMWQHGLGILWYLCLLFSNTVLVLSMLLEKAEAFIVIYTSKVHKIHRTVKLLSVYAVQYFRTCQSIRILSYEFFLNRKNKI